MLQCCFSNIKIHCQKFLNQFHLVVNEYRKNISNQIEKTYFIHGFIYAKLSNMTLEITSKKLILCSIHEQNFQNRKWITFIFKDDYIWNQRNGSLRALLDATSFEDKKNWGHELRKMDIFRSWKSQGNKCPLEPQEELSFVDI